MAEKTKLQRVSQFGVEFKTRKFDHITLDNFLTRTYRCSTYSLAEYITIYYAYQYLDDCRLFNYANKCINYYENSCGGDYSKLSNKDNYILYKMKWLVAQVETGKHQKSDKDITIHFDYYDLDDCILGKRYSEKYFVYQDELLKKNYAINMNHFDSLDSGQFNNALTQFLIRYPEFYEIDNLKEARIAGWYILVLDDYKQVYIGQSNLMADRILEHWKKNLEYDRRIVAGYERSKISIDSFGYKDITRIFIAEAKEVGNGLDEREVEYIDNFPNEYLTNRIRGGKVSVLQELKMR